uniref:Uncharacterized protein n=1 Tax=Strigamia maritima TaxID=126957 RepID=T1IVC3_STRMM
MQQLRRKLITKQTEIEELKSDRIPSQNLALLKLRVQEEIDIAYRERFALVEEETEQYRSECNKLRYELAFRKSEFEHSQATYAHIQDEMKLKHQSDLISLQKQNSDLQFTLDEQLQNRGEEKLNKAVRENTELQKRLRSLTEELQEMQAQKETSTIQAENLQRLQAKQNAEHMTNVRAMELENSTLKHQLERVQAELKQQREHEVELTAEIQTQQSEKNQLMSQLHEIEFKAKIDITNSKIELTKQKGEVERERDKLVIDIQDLKKDFEIIKKKNQSLNSMMMEKEKEMQRKMSIFQEEEWNKHKRTETEKFELEVRIQEMERLNVDSEHENQTLVLMAEEKSKMMLKEKEMLEKELANLRENGPEIVQLQSELKYCKQEKENCESAIRELREKIRREFDGDVQITNLDIERQRVQSDRLLMNAQITWEEQKSQLNNRILSLENQLGQLHSKHHDDKNNSQTRISKYRRAITKLQNRTNLQKARIDELETETEILKRNVTLDEHRSVQKQLRYLQRKHDEFRTVMVTSDPSAISLINEVPRPQTCYRDGADLDESKWDVKSDLDRKLEIEQVKERILKLDGQQKQQMIELETEPNTFEKS